MESDEPNAFIDFDLLPEEVLIQIFSCFDLEDLAVTSRVCSDVRIAPFFSSIFTPDNTVGHRFLSLLISCNFSRPALRPRYNCRPFLRRSRPFGAARLLGHPFSPEHTPYV